MQKIVKVVCGILINNNIVYLPKRATTLQHYPDFYEFPGGKLEDGENNIDALKRELYEELSITVYNSDIIAFPGNNIIYKNYDLTCYLVTDWCNKITINPDINSEIIEINIKDLHKIDNLLESDKILIKYIYRFLNI